MKEYFFTELLPHCLNSLLYFYILISTHISDFGNLVKTKDKEYLNRMVELGNMDVVKKCFEESLTKAEGLVDVKISTD